IQEIQTTLVRLGVVVVDVGLFHLLGQGVVGQYGKAVAQPEIVVDLQRIVANPGIVSAAGLAQRTAILRELLRQRAPVHSGGGVQTLPNEQRVVPERIRHRLLAEEWTAAAIEVALLLQRRI